MDKNEEFARQICLAQSLYEQARKAAWDEYLASERTQSDQDTLKNKLQAAYRAWADRAFALHELWKRRPE